MVRVTAYGPRVYFTTPMCIMDAFIVLIDVVSIIIEVWNLATVLVFYLSLIEPDLTFVSP
jgi:hypothetical protein